MDLENGTKVQNQEQCSYWVDERNKPNGLALSSLVMYGMCVTYSQCAN